MGRNNKRTDPSGILLVDKPAGMTSHDVVHVVRKVGQLAKVGHTGTLDPFATGVLPLCINRATRLASLFTNGDKGYDGVFRFGARTDTQDVTGEVIASEEGPIPKSLEEIEPFVQAFRGEIQQTPPMYSAVRVKGKRLYELARQGVEVEREKRTVTIRNYEALSLEDNLLSVRVLATKGTYVRTLADDLGRNIGCGAYVESLRRTVAGPFSIEQCLPLDEVVERIKAGELESCITPLEKALAFLPVLEVGPSSRNRLANGGKLSSQDLVNLKGVVPASTLLTVLCEGELLMVGETLVEISENSPGEGPIFKPTVVIGRPNANAPSRNKRVKQRTQGSPAIVTHRRAPRNKD